MNQILDASKVPTGPHFAVLVYRSERVSGYDPNTYDTITVVDHYATLDKDEWLDKVKYLKLEKANFVFFEVSKLSKASIKIEVDVQ